MLILMAFLFAYSLTGCGKEESAEELFSDYLWRLQNVTRTKNTPPPEEPEPLPSYPRYRELHLEITAIRVGFGDYFSLDQCQMMQEISQHNSSLGRLSSTATALLYESQFLSKIEACKTKFAEVSGEEQEAFQATLKQIAQIKQKNWPQRLWNSSFASAEFQSLFSPAHGALSTENQVKTEQLAHALQGLLNIVTAPNGQSLTLNEDAVKQIYFVTQAEAIITPILKGMQIAAIYLDEASNTLESTTQRRILCPMEKTTPQARYAHNVFVKYYAGGIQPYLGQLHGAGQRIFPLLNQLLKAQRLSPPATFSAYFEATLAERNPQSLWQSFETQLKRHTKAWQALLKQCDLMPKGPESLRILPTSQ